MTNNLTLVKIFTEKLFTPGKSYKINQGKNAIPLSCVQSLENAWVFSTDRSVESMNKFFNSNGINGNLTTDEGTIKTGELVMIPLLFNGIRENNK